MKKLLTCLLTLTLLLSSANPLFAAISDISFFAAIGNMTDIKDHKAVQSFYGNAEFKEAGDHISVEYRISINGVTGNDNGLNNFSRLSAFLKFTNHNEVNDSTPFKEMMVQANAEMISQDQKDLYFKLNNFNIGLIEPLPFAVMDIENMRAMADLYRNKWFHMSVNELAANGFDGETVDLDQYIALQEGLKENPKEAILKISELALSDSEAGFMEEELGEFMEVIGLLLENQLFTQRDVITGRNTDFKFFNLNKSAILNLMEEVAAVFGEEMTTEDKLTIRAGLGKISLSGIYRVEEMHDIIDNLLVRFRLREIGPLLNLEVNYRFKIWDIDKENNVKIPTEYEEWSNPFGNSDEELLHEDEWPEEEFSEEEF